MPAQCTLWHSEHGHGEKFGFPEYFRSLSTKEYTCAVRAEMSHEPWTFVTCPLLNDLDDDRGCHLCQEDEHVAHKDAIVIAVDGACRGNGTRWAQSGIGVFFHRNSHYNRALRIDNTPYGHTNQRAELFAGLEALKLADRSQNENPRPGTERGGLPPPGPERKLRRVVIMADSKYLVDAMTDWVFKWEDNGYLNARGQSVVNEDLFRRLEQAIDDLNDAKVDVQFWHVRREDNGIADCLANAAPDCRDPDETLDDYFDN